MMGRDKWYIEGDHPGSVGGPFRLRPNYDLSFSFLFFLLINCLSAFCNFCPCFPLNCHCVLRNKNPYQIWSILSFCRLHSGQCHYLRQPRQRHIDAKYPVERPNSTKGAMNQMSSFLSVPTPAPDLTQNLHQLRRNSRLGNMHLMTCGR